MTNDLLGKAKRIAVEVAARHAEDVDSNARFPSEAIDALRRERLLGVAVPVELGGNEASLATMASMCEALGQHCASTAMIYAMHLIQVGTIVRHSAGSAFFPPYLVDLVEKQLLIASITSEVGVGGDLRSSIAAVERNGETFVLEKSATTASYCEDADALLVTARRSRDAAANDQVIVLLKKGDYKLDSKGAWDTLGMRGTCSPSIHMTASAGAGQILSPFSDIACQTVIPYSHVLWSSCWLGIATAAYSHARAFVRQQARAKPGSTPPTALRLAELSNIHQLFRNSVYGAAAECDAIMASPRAPEILSSIGFALKMNNLKVSSSELVFRIVHHALQICGIAAYRNDSKLSLGRHLRDACSAALMVGNDRIYSANASMLLVLKDD